MTASLATSEVASIASLRSPSPTTGQNGRSTRSSPAAPGLHPARRRAGRADPGPAATAGPTNPPSRARTRAPLALTPRDWRRDRRARRRQRVKPTRPVASNNHPASIARDLRADLPGRSACRLNRAALPPSPSSTSERPGPASEPIRRPGCCSRVKTSGTTELRRGQTQRREDLAPVAHVRSARPALTPCAGWIDPAIEGKRAGCAIPSAAIRSPPRPSASGESSHPAGEPVAGARQRLPGHVRQQRAGECGQCLEARGRMRPRSRRPRPATRPSP